MLQSPPDRIHRLLDQHFSLRLQLCRNKFWTAFRWMAINTSTPEEKPHFFEDYIMADDFCSKKTTYRIISISRAIKLLLNKCPIKISSSTLYEFCESIKTFPILLDMPTNYLIDFLSLNEYLPIKWHHNYNPLSRCGLYHIVEIPHPRMNTLKKIVLKISYTSSHFPKILREFQKRIESFQNKVTSCNIYLIGQFKDYKFDISKAENIFNNETIVFYSYDLDSLSNIFPPRIIQFQDPTQVATSVYNYFIKYDLDKKKILFLSSQLKCCNPGSLDQQYSSRHFLGKPISRYDLIPFKIFR